MTSDLSLFLNAMQQTPCGEITLQEAISAIRGGRWQRAVGILRTHVANGDRRRYDQKKKDLPAITLSCHCNSRRHNLSPEDKGVVHSGWLQADFDLKDNPILNTPEVVADIRSRLLSDPHVGAVFVGPSGEGIKAVVSIDPSRHKDSWFAAEAYFLDGYQLKIDKSTKDPMRLCFVSHDTEAATSDEFSPLHLPDVSPTEEREWMPPIETTSSDIEEMLAFCPPRPDYDTWLRVASAVWSVLPMAEGCQVLHHWSPEEHEGEYASKHRARLQQVGIGTLVHLASQHGFDAREAWCRKRWAGRIRFAEGVVAPGQGEDPAADTAEVTCADISRERVMRGFREGQAGDARLWCDTRRGLRIWNIHGKVWMVYGEGIYRRDMGNATPWEISDHLCNLYSGISDTIREEMAAQPAPDGKKDPRAKEIADIAARIAQLQKWEYISSVQKFSLRALHARATDFDSNSDLLALENGTLDFSEGVFREHRGADMLTTRSRIPFDTDATCPTWDAFLELTQPNVEVREYLARAVGYSLTGRVNEDVLFFCHGGGANGKSTFFGALKILLGDHMTTVPIAALLAAKSDNNFDYHKASMEGKRVVLTDEIPDRRKLAPHQIKAIVGGDAINARRPFEQPYTFFPTHKLWLMGNHKPDITDTDEGIWRRVHMIPWQVTIPLGDRRARHEVMADFQREAAGILNWAIRGLLDVQEGGLNAPEQVVEATREYREDSDQFGTFLTECTEKSILGVTLISSIGKCYKAWCEQNDEQPRHRGTKAIRKVMQERKWTVETSTRNVPVVLGLVLKTEEASNILNLSQN